MITEEGNIYGCKNEPNDKKSNACSSEEDANVIDADGEETKKDPHNSCRRQRHIWYPVLGTVMGESYDDEVEDGEANKETKEEEDYFDQPIACQCVCWECVKEGKVDSYNDVYTLVKLKSK